MNKDQQPVFKNFVQLTQVVYNDQKQFAFGFLKEPVPRMVFFPHWIVKAFELSADDVGFDVEVIFVEQEGRNPLVIGIIESDDALKPSAMVGTMTGNPGTTNSFAKLEDVLPRRSMLEQICNGKRKILTLPNKTTPAHV